MKYLNFTGQKSVFDRIILNSWENWQVRIQNKSKKEKRLHKMKNNENQTFKNCCLHRNLLAVFAPSKITNNFSPDHFSFRPQKRDKLSESEDIKSPFRALTDLLDINEQQWNLWFQRSLSALPAVSERSKNITALVKLHLNPMPTLYRLVILAFFETNP